MHPFLDVSKLTDEDIITRLSKAYSYMNYQSSLGHSPTVQSIRDIIQSLEYERAHRMNKRMNDNYTAKNPDLLKPIELGELEDLIRKSL